MSSMHPHWATEEGAVEVPVNAKRTAVPVATVSRRPAAIAGIAVVLALGVFLLAQNGDLSLPAQTTSSVDIRITPDGFVPQAFAVTAGQTITWINEDSIPHILASTNLPTEASNPMESPPIFPGQRFTITVPDDTPESDYTYISRTSASLNGAVTVSALSAMAQNDANQNTSADFPTDDDTDVLPTPTGNTASPTDWSTVDDTPSAPVRAPSGLPTNPYTVGTAAYRSGGSTVTQQYSSARSERQTTTTTTAQTTPPAQYHRPTTQPESGMDTWALLAVGVCALWILARRALPIQR